MVNFKKFLNLTKFFLGWPLGIIAILFVLKFILLNSSTVLPKLGHINFILLFFGLLSFLVYYFLRIFAWWKIMEYIGYKLNYKKTSYAWQFSEIKRYVPGNVWSFLSRATLFERLGVKKKDSGRAILYELEFLIFSNLIISIFATPLISSYLKLNQNILITIQILIITLAGAAIIWGQKLKSSILPTFESNQNLVLTVIFLISFLFFSLGTYLSTASVLGSLQNPVLLIGFFSFAFLLGYLSLITPSGIGVREAVVTYGLSSLFSVPIAGLIALFSRIMLVLSELIFTGFVFLWNQRK